MEKERRQMSTADLARKADAADNAVLERDPITGRERISPPNAEQRTMLFEDQEARDFRTRWTDAQAAFVDSPREAVQRADSLVAEAMKRLAEVFSKERANLEGQWDRGDNVTTEDLRIALQRYRAFFDRLLNV
jgi:hypothetical protein